MEAGAFPSTTLDYTLVIIQRVRVRPLRPFMQIPSLGVRPSLDMNLRTGHRTLQVICTEFGLYPQQHGIAACDLEYKLVAFATGQSWHRVLAVQWYRLVGGCEKIDLGLTVSKRSKAMSVNAHSS